LRHHVGADDFLNEELPPKLRHRLSGGLGAVKLKGASKVISKTPLKTYDQKLQRQLRLQFEDMAPALAKIRGVALDVGMY